MLTVLLAWIEAKYNYGYDILFFGTIFLDMCLFATLDNIF